MNNDERLSLVFREFLDKTDDGFIVIDVNGIVTDINQNYCDFLELSKEDCIGKKIETFIPTTSMYDVLNNRIRGDGPEGFHVQAYLIKGKSAGSKEDYCISNRFCIFDEDGTLIGAAAQMKFKQRALNMADKIYKEEVKYYKEEYQNSTLNTGGFDKLIGSNSKLTEMKNKGIRIAKTDFPVLITGETGTGKELFAKALHVESDRYDKPLICINCAAIPSELLESELFGYEEGAFTGAKKGGKIGKFQLAEGGTIFLDEIGDMPLNLQAKLLRVLQEAEIEKVGGNQTIPINVRVISATRRDLPRMMETGSFREDLYFRLNVINFDMPPLRDRPDDILIYANYFLNELNNKYKTTTLLSYSARRCLRKYIWPGNVREVKNVISSAYASCDKYVIGVSELPAKIASLNTETVDIQERKVHNGLRHIMDECESDAIREALQRHRQNVKCAADELQIDRSVLYKKMKRLNIEVLCTVK